MTTIALEGMQFRGYHGHYEEENVLGGDYEVDVFIGTSIGKAAATDDLNHTINYETVYFICEAEFRQSHKLIETIIENIVYNLKHQFSTIQSLTVKVKKLDPPLGGKVRMASVEKEESYRSKCGRCGRGITCYGDENCWCFNLNINSKTREHIDSKYAGCLCKSCLTYFASI